jgi:hypothetical protein
MFTDQEVNTLIARVNFYESCVDQLKKELPKYLSKQGRLTNTTQSLKKALRNVASNEPETKLQNCLFLYAAKHEVLEKERVIFEKCEGRVMSILNESKDFSIKPLKEIINLSPQTRANRDLAYPDPTLPVHSHFFEVHRIKSLKRAIRNMVHTELTYHARVIENLTEVLAAIDNMDNDEDV